MLYTSNDDDMGVDIMSDRRRQQRIKYSGRRMLRTVVNATQTEFWIFLSMAPELARHRVYVQGGPYACIFLYPLRRDGDCASLTALWLGVNASYWTAANMQFDLMLDRVQRVVC